MKAIWPKGLLDEMNVTVMFVRSVEVGEDAEIKLAASNLYRFWVNGKLVGYGPARAARGYSRLDTYSLAEFCGHPAEIKVEVFSANINTYYIIDEKPFFACEVTAGGRIVAEAPDFEAYLWNERVKKVRRFSFQRAFTEIYHFTGCASSAYTPVETAEVAMNRLLPRNVHYPRLDLHKAEKWIEDGTVSLNPNAEGWHDRAFNISPEFKGYRAGELEEDAGDEIVKFVYTAGKAQKAVGPMGYRIYDFGRTLTGFFSVKLAAKTVSTVYIVFDEIKTDCGDHTGISPFRNNCCNVIKYTVPMGRHDFLAFEANSARFATVVVTDGEVDIDEFGMVSYENPDAASYRFDCHDDTLNAIVGAAVNTFAQNAVDILTDCPSRERAGWLCDSYFSSRAEALFTGRNLVERNFLENYALCDESRFSPAGMVPMCYPSDHNNGVYIPTWAMWYVLELRNYCRRTGDSAMAELSKGKIFGIVDFFKRFENEHGLLENLESWVFIEWSRCNDPDFVCGVNYPANMLWAAALEAAGDLYGDNALAAKGRATKDRIRELSFNGEFFEDNAVRGCSGNLVKTGHTSETAQYYAFYFGVASRETFPELFEKMRTLFGPKRDDKAVYPNVFRSNVFVGNYLRLEILKDNGFRDQVLGECRDFFSKMPKMTGTLWEHSAPTCSLDHGFASVAAVYIAECV